MLFSAVSNWPASAASRSRATSACMNILCRLAEMLHERQTKNSAQQPTCRCNRACHATPARAQSDRGQQDLQMEYPRPSVGPARTARRDSPVVTDRQIMWATASSLLNRVTTAPDADRGGLDHRADLVALLPLRGFVGSQRRLARAGIAACRTRGRRRSTIRSATHGHRQMFAGLQRRHGRRDGGEDDARKQRTGSSRTANRSAPRKSTATSSDRLLGSGRPAASARARPFRGA